MRLLILGLIAALAFVSWRLADVERQRYAALVGICPDTITTIDPVCLKTSQPRENNLWNLYYGLMP